MGRPWSGRPSAFFWGGSGEGFLFLHSEWGPSFRTGRAGCAHRLPIGGGAQRGASGGHSSPTRRSPHGWARTKKGSARVSGDYHVATPFGRARLQPGLIPFWV